MKTKYFIDFDDTLFDRDKFRADLFKIFSDLGFSDEEREESYRAVYENGYQGPEAQLQYLYDNIRQFNIDEARDKVWNLLKDLKRYLFPEAVNFINSIDRDKYEVHILTVGGVDFQKTKVRNSGIEELVGSGNCHYTIDKKHMKLDSLVEKGEPFILLEDKAETIAEVKEAYPEAIVLEAKGGDLMQHNDPERLDFYENSENTEANITA